MCQMSVDAIYNWMADHDTFLYEFKRYCVTTLQAFNIHCTFDDAELALACRAWSADCEVWRTKQFEAEAQFISPMKAVALLLFNLSQVRFISSMSNHKFDTDRVDYTFQGSGEEFTEARDDLTAAPEAVLSFDFSMSVLCWYERYRIDRFETFVYRITSELRHDFLSYITGRSTEARGLYLALEAAFVRTVKQPPAANTPSTRG